MITLAHVHRLILLIILSFLALVNAFFLGESKSLIISVFVDSLFLSIKLIILVIVWVRLSMIRLTTHARALQHSSITHHPTSVIAKSHLLMIQLQILANVCHLSFLMKPLKLVFAVLPSDTTSMQALALVLYHFSTINQPIHVLASTIWSSMTKFPRTPAAAYLH